MSHNTLLTKGFASDKKNSYVIPLKLFTEQQSYTTCRPTTMIKNDEI